MFINISLPKLLISLFKKEVCYLKLPKILQKVPILYSQHPVICQVAASCVSWCNEAGYPALYVQNQRKSLHLQIQKSGCWFVNANIYLKEWPRMVYLLTILSMQHFDFLCGILKKKGGKYYLILMSSALLLLIATGSCWALVTLPKKNSFVILTMVAVVKELWKWNVCVGGLEENNKFRVTTIAMREKHKTMPLNIICENKKICKFTPGNQWVHDNRVHTGDSHLIALWLQQHDCN